MLGISWRILWSTCFLLSLSGTYCKTNNFKKLLLISLDGFRFDYLELAKTAGVNISAFEKIWHTGFRAERVENEFVTRTAPNHISMVTGLHEESHGIVDNDFFDPSLNATFSLSDLSQASGSRWFNTGLEPIWVTNQRHGYKSGITFWPGSQIKIKDVLPSYYYPVFNTSLPFKTSIDSAFNWFLNNDVNLVLLYNEQPDIQGHITGPNSKEVYETIGRLNKDLEYLLLKLQSYPNLRQQLNIIVTSDHGMSEVNSKQYVYLDDYLDKDMYFSPGNSVRILWAFWPNAGYSADDIYNKLFNKHKQLHVYRKQDIPRRLFYSTSVRIAPVIAFVDPGWLITSNRSQSEAFSLRGVHGYDPKFSEMSPFFLASGPGIKRLSGNGTIPLLKMVDIYPMMCHLLGLDNPAPHNGSLSRIWHILNHRIEKLPWTKTALDSFTVTILLGIVLISATVFSVCACLQGRLNAAATSSIVFQRRARMRQQQKQTTSSHHTSSNVLVQMKTLRSGDRMQSVEQQQLLNSVSEDDDVATNHQSDLDDKALIEMLHGPKWRYP